MKKRVSSQKTKATAATSSQTQSTIESSTVSSVSSEVTKSIRKVFEDKFTPHENSKVNKLRQTAQKLRLEFSVQGVIAKDEEVIAIVNKSTNPAKHGREALYPGEKCSPTLIVRSRSQFATEQDFTWSNDIVGGPKPETLEVKEMVEIRKTALALLVTDYGFGLTTLELIPKKSPVFLYEGEVKNIKKDTPYTAIIEKDEKIIEIYGGNYRGYGNFAQHLFDENTEDFNFYDFALEDASNIARANVECCDRLGLPLSPRTFFYATSDILPLSHIGYSYGLDYFKRLSIPMAPFSLVDGFSLNYYMKMFCVNISYLEFDTTFEAIFPANIAVKTDPLKVLETVNRKMQALEVTDLETTRSSPRLPPALEKMMGKKDYVFLREGFLLKREEIIKIDNFLNNGVAFFTITAGNQPAVIYMMYLKQRYLQSIQKFIALMDDHKSSSDSKIIKNELDLSYKLLEKILILLTPSQQQDNPVSEKRKEFFEDQKATVTALQQIFNTQAPPLTEEAGKKNRKKLFATYEITEKHGDLAMREALLLRRIAYSADLVSLQCFLNICKSISQHINKTTSQGKTPFHLASESKEKTGLAVCMLLLHQKADPTIADSAGKTPYKYVEGSKHLTLLFKKNQVTSPSSYQIKDEDVDPDKLYKAIEEEEHEQCLKLR